KKATWRTDLQWPECESPTRVFTTKLTRRVPVARPRLTSGTDSHVNAHLPGAAPPRVLPLFVAGPQRPPRRGQEAPQHVQAPRPLQPRAGGGREQGGAPGSVRHLAGRLRPGRPSSAGRAGHAAGLILPTEHLAARRAYHRHQLVARWADDAVKPGE